MSTVTDPRPRFASPNAHSGPDDPRSAVHLPAGAALVVAPNGSVVAERKPFPLPRAGAGRLTGRLLEEVEPPALGQSLRRLWLLCRQDGSLHLSQVEIGLEPEDPSSLWSLSLGAVAHHDFPDYCVITVRDVARHTREVQDLLHTIQALRDERDRWQVATRTTAHDARSSLSAVIGFLQLSLRDRANLPAAVEKQLLEAIDIGKRLHGVLKDLEQSEEPRAVDSERVAVAGLGQRLFQALHAAHPSEVFTWHVESAEQAVRVPMQVTWNVLWNVLTNSLKYRCEDRPLHIGLRGWMAEGAVQLEIRDSGRGIPEGEEESVFSWGHRCAGGEGVEGSGFGLFSARQQLASCGGRIWIEPCPDGALVRISMPLDDDRPLSSAESTR